MKHFSVQTIFVNDRPLSMAGMEFVATNSRAIDLIGTCASVDDFLTMLHDSSGEVAVIDYSIRGKDRMQGLALLGYLQRTYSDLRIVSLVSHVNPVIIRSILEQGVSAVVSKFDDVGHIITAIHVSYGGGHYLSPVIKNTLCAAGEGNQKARKLSPREIEVIRLYLSGLSIQKIAALLNKGKQTVSAQKISAMRKLGAKNDIDLIKSAAALDLVDEADVTRAILS
ncbi:LuxR C-terminal-related transcriptional regulator [Burkholderia lata]|uniref:LuxR C-terminal-related transcriptional regulator n=1 Tax=Burkholderia lata (strain ATCC 17760 / DSM 23089 / LMG 22485 / NCIMB 9086 / R18194 / 383) TaxID=482957 RepID=UPI00399ADAE5